MTERPGDDSGVDLGGSAPGPLVAALFAIGKTDRAALPREDGAVTTPAIVDDCAVIDCSHYGLQHCLDRLTADERYAIRTAFLYGASYTELAAQFEVSLETMKSRVRHGLGKLKSCLGDYARR